MRSALFNFGQRASGERTDGAAAEAPPIPGNVFSPACRRSHTGPAKKLSHPPICFFCFVLFYSWKFWDSATDCIEVDGGTSRCVCAPVVRRRELCVTPLAVILGLLLLYVLHITLTPTVTP